MLRSFMPFAIAALLLLGTAHAVASDPSATPEDPPYGLSPEQWQHVLDGNEGRAEELQLGDVAPDFELPSLDGKATTKLSSFRSERPVVLFFGSYT